MGVVTLVLPGSPNTVRFTPREQSGKIRSPPTQTSVVDSNQRAHHFPTKSIMAPFGTIIRLLALWQSDTRDDADAFCLAPSTKCFSESAWYNRFAGPLACQSRSYESLEVRIARFSRGEGHVMQSS